MKQLTQVEIILETVKYYGEDPKGRRGLKPSLHTTKGYTCQYVVTNGVTKYCAVGRVLNHQFDEWAEDMNGSVEDMLEEYWIEHHARAEAEQRGITDFKFFDPSITEAAHDEEFYMDELLQPQYRGHTVQFWSDLQQLHDTDAYWSGEDDKWLTHQGMDYITLFAGEHGLTKEERDELFAGLMGRAEP